MEIDGNTGIGGNPDVVVVVDRHARRGVLGSKFWQHVVRDVDWGGAIVGDGQSPVDEGYPEVAVGAKEERADGRIARGEEVVCLLGVDVHGEEAVVVGGEVGLFLSVGDDAHDL